MGIKCTLAAGLLGLVAAANVQAGDYQQRLGECLVASSTEADKQALVRWIFYAMSRHPGVADLVDIDDVHGERLTREAAAVFEDLIAQRCAAQSRQAILKEGMAAFQSAFGTLGEVAMGGIITAPEVAHVVGGLARHADEERILRALMGDEKLRKD
ncbi:hypothetical protein [Marilutibacter aestuarii]|uniref:Uncharacterized protein n=1 Tax=Marilutibacter aestuarii TaxID=1706195 RepID=A0A508AMH0_9GAMM|nr:hypothetical protein [Lysobacter aestuarii]TQD51320.1 hypothetical protein FKV25_01635 [Lysobacter aestuarii]